MPKIGKSINIIRAMKDEIWDGLLGFKFSILIIKTFAMHFSLIITFIYSLTSYACILGEVFC